MWNPASQDSAASGTSEKEKKVMVFVVVSVQQLVL
jgi:hypothetical protein